MTETPLFRSPRTLSRWQATALQVVVSTAVAGIVSSLIAGLWYPGALFTAEGGRRLVLFLVGLDLALGPLLTLIVFQPGKPSLRSDLTILSAIRGTVLLAGLYVAFQARPVYIVFTGNRFETVRANDIGRGGPEGTSPGPYDTLPLTGPQYVGLDLPGGKTLSAIIAYGNATGTPVTELPRFYVPYERQRQQAWEAARALDATLKGTDAFAHEVQDKVAAVGRPAAQLRLLPMQTRMGWGAVLLDAASGSIVAQVPAVAD